MKIPLLYPILDADSLSASCEEGKLLQAVCSHALALAEAGCTLLQYRAKRLNVREALAQARELRRLLPGVTLIMNDRADLCLAAGFDGVHVGQDDLSPEGVRRVVGADSIVGLSTHNSVQMAEALDEAGGLPGHRSRLCHRQQAESGSGGWHWPVSPRLGACAMTPDGRFRWWPSAASPAPMPRPFCKAGADSVAVIGDLSRSPRESAREFFRLMM